MKIQLVLLVVLILLLIVPKAQAQYAVAVVADPIAEANHADDIAKWLQSIQALNTQIQQFQQQIQLAQTVVNFVGNPQEAAQAMELQLLDSTGLTQSVGQLTSSLNQTVNGALALENSGSQLFGSVSNLTSGGMKMNFDPNHFLPYSAIQSQSANVSNVIKSTTALIQGLQQQKAATLSLIKAAPNQSVVQKLTAEVDAIDGQIAALGQQQQTSTDQIVTQNIANENDREMKSQAANESADHEMNVSIQNFMQWSGQITSDRTDFK